MNDTNENAFNFNNSSLCPKEGLFTIAPSKLTTPSITFTYGDKVGARVTIDLEKGDVIIEGGINLPEAAQLFWEAVRKSLISDYKLLPIDEYKKLLDKTK
jgi:hypothetical protein